MERSGADFFDFTRILFGWYRHNKRALPWRETRDPYRIWVAEIIFQQTRIDQGMNYYHRFVERFPDVFALADAKEDEVLRIWQGLGYYSRARNMLVSARQLVEHHRGIFPNTAKELQKLKGIGEYTASCIASVCFGEPVAAIDGNLTRVISRFAGIDEPIGSAKSKAAVLEAAGHYLDPARPGDFNEALMDFGSLVCKPLLPDCPHCPLSAGCYAHQTKRVHELPVKRQALTRKSRFFHVVLSINDAGFVIRKRASDDIWMGLWELPYIETSENESIPFQGSLIFSSTHVLTHQKIHMKFYLSEDYPTLGVANDTHRIHSEDIVRYAFPKPVLAFLQYYFKNTDEK
jgi:A/G-specific adenine glycosylase